ncbi:MAG: GNAT family N-acetyltransferase [Candidatus Marinimicrobia bacterium]|nr:GNAT family N-acetyltransferase [Candidatus Neomarinimicrobiota bacterium]
MLTSTLNTELEKRDLQLVTAGEVKGFVDAADEVSLVSWPEFMLHDEVANQYWYTLNDKFANFQFALLNKTSHQWVAVGNSIPVHWTGELQNLPDEGWDWALESGMTSDESPNLLCALAIQILPDQRGVGLSSLMVRIMKEIGHHAGFDQLIAPVRPSQKCDYPLLSMETYIGWQKDDKCFDPWIRVHERLGAQIMKICPQSMQISGRVKEWQDWTGLSFQSSSTYIISSALTTVKIDIANDSGIYTEPNVWMVHRYNNQKV